MKKLLVVGLGVILLNGCVTKSAIQKEAPKSDEPVAVASSVSMVLTQEMIDRFNKTHPNK